MRPWVSTTRARSWVCLAALVQVAALQGAGCRTQPRPASPPAQAVTGGTETAPPAPVVSETVSRCGVWERGDGPGNDLPFPMGIASGGVRSTSAVVWTQTRGRRSVRAHFSPGPSCPETVTPPHLSAGAAGHTVKIELRGLEPATVYRYRLEVVGAGRLSRPAFFVTAPVEDRPFRLAFSADVSHKSSHFGLLSGLVEAGPDLYLSLGDWPYSDRRPRAENLFEFRSRHREARRHPDVRSLTRAVAIHAVWDDHEILNDWDGADTKAYPALVRDGVRAWREVFPVVGAARGEIYRSYRWGPQVEIFHLDCRSHRDANSAADGVSKTMLGPRQLEWLLAGLRRSGAAFKLVVTSVPLAAGTTGLDQWTGFRGERDLLLRHIVDHRIGGVVFLTADQHWLSVHHLPEGPKEFQTGPLAQFLRRPEPAQPPWVLLQSPVLNFGLVDYAPSPTPSLTFSAVGQQGVIYTERIAAGVGQIEVRSDPFMLWRLKGAHVFSGLGPRLLPWATPGDYEIQWSSALPDAEAPRVQRSSLSDQGEVSFEATERVPSYAEAFEAPSGAWRGHFEGDCEGSAWKFEGGQAVAGGGRCGGRRGARPGVVLVNETLRFEEGVLAVRIKAGPRSRPGLRYGLGPSGQGYELVYDAADSKLRLRRLSGPRALLKEVSVAPAVGRFFALAVERRGGLHRVFVDGDLLMEVRAGPPRPGGVALRADVSDAASFDDLWIYNNE